MRSAFINSLIASAREDKNIFLLVADVGYSLVEPFKEEFPNRFINIGIAEQNMIGIAAGLAMSGKTVFVYSLANFPTVRCVEHIRNDVCYHKANVKIVASGGGLAYGALGATHHVTEDIGLMRVIPNMTIIAPADPVESELATYQIARNPGPCYLRLEKTGDPIIHKTSLDFKVGKAITVRNGKDITLIATGGILKNAIAATEQLALKDIQSRVISMHTIKPIDKETILSAAKETKAIITVEEHNIIGGLGSAVSEVLGEDNHLNIPFKRLGITDTFNSQVGSQAYLQEAHSLSSQSIAAISESLLNNTMKQS